MPEVSATNEVITRICDVLSDQKKIAVGEVMTAAAIVAITAGLTDEQALAALQSGLKAIRQIDMTVN